MAFEGGDRTEQASERRLQKAYEEGQVPLSRDLTTLASMAVMSLTLAFSASHLRELLITLVTTPLRTVADPHLETLWALAMPPAIRVVGAIGAAAAAALAVTLAQTRGGFWVDLVGPRFDRMFRGGVIRIFGKDLWIDLGISTVKLMAIGLALWRALSGDFMTLQGQLLASPQGQFANLFASLTKLATWILGAFAVFAGTDLAMSHFRFRSKMRMTREEIKREHQEEEGNPLIRSRRRRKHRELAKGRPALEVPRADVVVVNPTHFAVAIRYRRGVDAAPRVVAKGKGVIAETIRDLARSHGVPIVEDIPLARFLHKRVKVGTEIPAEMFKAVAAVLAFVYRITRQSAAAGAGAVR